ncbi:hypothetical protein KIH74_19305 [Kineosporia sp. J2-2]|uniref:Tryptophan-associated transmembrane protein n=1 Tax=Kineosporia corallincola TaxID=2835133 RepID=A0ABS5TJ47_9ACTN|nr:hypothetical protein [Kineosporia corallincola]MBT0771096.1 hypothetical protein [Kineosporia corallincola]
MSMIDERPGPGATKKPKLLAGETVALVLPIVLGIVVAVAWRLLLPLTEKLGDETELQAAVDGTLAGLGLLTGLLLGIGALLRPGRYPVRRVTALLVTSTLGGAISWLLGNTLGTPVLRGVGAAFIWPATTAVVIMVGAILPWTSHRLDQASRPAEPYGLRWDDEPDPARAEAPGERPAS